MPPRERPDANFLIAPDSTLANGRYIVAMKTSEHQVPGDRVIVTVSADESLGGLFQFEYICRTVTSAPKDHVHISREESVEILEGTLHCRAGGQERVLRAGERVVIAAGIPHALWNEDQSGCRAIAEHRRVAGDRARLEDYFVGAALPTAAK
jgi:quercetin dioxygenase-like cupin family protein